MAWQITTDVAEFLDATGEELRRERARNTVLLTVAEGVRQAGWPADRGPVLSGWIRGDDGIAGIFMRTPPYPALLTTMPGWAAAELARELAARRAELAGVNADVATAGSFTQEWQRLTGAADEVDMRLRLFRLGTLSTPAPAPDGGPRVAREQDAGLLAGWFGEFANEVGETSGSDPARAVNDRLSYRGLTLWETADGEPVSMAGLSREVAGMVRVAPVYTPPRHRAKGYAGAVTAEVSSQALRAGADEVLLFTDLANPTSNALYQRIGYRPVEDRVQIRFKLP